MIRNALLAAALLSLPALAQEVSGEEETRAEDAVVLSHPESANPAAKRRDDRAMVTTLLDGLFGGQARSPIFNHSGLSVAIKVGADGLQPDDGSLNAAAGLSGLGARGSSSGSGPELGLSSGGGVNACVFARVGNLKLHHAAGGTALSATAPLAFAQVDSVE